MWVGCRGGRGLKKEAPRAGLLTMSLPLCVPELPSPGQTRNSGPGQPDLDLPQGPVLQSHSWPPDPTRPKQEGNTRKPVTGSTLALDLPLLSVFAKADPGSPGARVTAAAVTHTTPSTCPTHTAPTPAGLTMGCTWQPLTGRLQKTFGPPGSKNTWSEQNFIKFTNQGSLSHTHT